MGSVTGRRKWGRREFLEGLEGRVLLSAGYFQNGPSYAVGNVPQAEVLGDFNGDGKLDVAVANSWDSTVSVLLGTGDGGFLPKVDVPTGYVPLAIARGDFDGDGRMDLVSLNLDDSVSVLLGDGAGGFTSRKDTPFDAAISFRPPQGPGGPAGLGAIAVADFNGDGKADVAIAGIGGGARLAILLGNGDGTFGTAPALAGSDSVMADLAAGDFNHDGKKDLAITTNTGVGVLLGNGDGTFGPEVDIAAGYCASSVVVADFNGDGKQDLAVSSFASGDFSGHSNSVVTVLLGTGDGGFLAQAPYDEGSSYVNVLAAGDLNGDGKVDLASIYAGQGGSVLEIRGNGDGTLGPTVSFGGPGMATSIAASDLNGDGLPDLVMADEGRAMLDVSLNDAVTVPTTTTLTANGSATTLVTAYGDVIHIIASADSWVDGGSFELSLDGIAQGEPETPGPESRSVYWSVTNLAVGTHTVSATNSGVGNYLASVSPTVTLVVEKKSISTTVTSSNLIAAAGDNVVFTAAVLWGSGGVPTGTMQFEIDGANLGLPVSLDSSGKASFGTSSLTPGIHTVVAVYSGDEHDLGNNSGAIYERVGLWNTTTAIVSSKPAAVLGDSITLTATVTPAGGNGVTGTVAFLVDGGAISPLVPVSGNVASWTTGLWVGTHSIQAYYSGNGSYSNSWSTAITQTVATITPAITWAPGPITFGTAISATQLNATASVPGVFSYSMALGTMLQVGSWPVNVTFMPTDTGEYGEATTSANLVVSKAMLTATAAGKTRAYGVANPALTYALSGFVNGDTVSVVSGAAGLSTSATPTSTPNVYPINVTLGSLAAADYTFNFVAGTLTVTKAGTGTVVTASAGTVGYGQAVTMTATVTPVSGSGVTGSVQFVVDGVNVGLPVAVSGGTAVLMTSALAPGGHALSAVYGGDGNFQASTAAGVNVGVGTIVPTITWNTPGAMTYGTAVGAGQLNATASVPGTFGYSVAAGTVLHAGVWPVTVTFTPTDLVNYSVATASVNLTVNRATLTVTAADKGRAYGVANPALTYGIAGFVNGDGSGVVSGAASVATTATVASGVGTYPITVAAGSLAAADYTFSFVGGSLTVGKAGTVTVVTASAGTVGYGGAVTMTATVTPGSGSGVTGTVQFMEDGKALGLPVAVSGGVASLTSSALGAGSHALSAVYSGDGNFSGSTAESIGLVESKATPVITWATPAAMTYGAAVSGAQLNASASGVAGVMSYSVPAGTVWHVGSHAVTATFTPTDTANYDVATKSVNVTVNKAVLTVRGDIKSRTVGLANPALTYTLSGFVNGDGAGVVSGAAVLSTTATTASAIGPYAISVAAGTLAASDYSFSLINGTLFVVADTTAPTAGLSSHDLMATGGSAAYQFQVNFSDDVAMNESTLMSNAIVCVTGPNGFSQYATYVSLIHMAGSAVWTAKFQIAAPSGGWSDNAAGMYTVSLLGTLAADTSGNKVPAGALGSFYYSPNLYFDERYYLALYPDVAAAISAGGFKSGYQHFMMYGQYENRLPSPEFDPQYYLRLNPDVASAVANHTFASAFVHFVNYGVKEGRPGSTYFNEWRYRLMYPDIAAAVAAGQFSSGLQHYLLFGQQEGRSPSEWFDEGAYRIANPTAAALVSSGAYQSGFEQYRCVGVTQGYCPLAGFDEAYYLVHNPDVANGVKLGWFRSGFDHYLLSGQFEGRSPSASFDEWYYLTNNPDVKAAVAAKQYTCGFEHYLLAGKAEGRKGHA